VTAPSIIRINLNAPFPTLVKGSGPITVTKINGIWTIALTAAAIGVQTPPAQNYATDFVLVWDNVAQQWIQVSFAALITAAQVGASARAQRSVTSAPAVLSTDSIINFSLLAPASITLPAFASRLGAPLTFNDSGGTFNTNPLTVVPNGAETISGIYTNASPLILRSPLSVTTLVPYNDTVNSGWFLA
jgi:hypothetical protein